MKQIKDSRPNIPLGKVELDVLPYVQVQYMWSEEGKLKNNRGDLVQYIGRCRERTESQSKLFFYVCSARVFSGR